MPDVPCDDDKNDGCGSQESELLDTAKEASHLMSRFLEGGQGQGWEGQRSQCGYNVDLTVWW